MEKQILIFLGAPGSGKGSLSQVCNKRLGWAQLSTGNLCRKHTKEQTEIGQQIDFSIKSGKLISDSLIICMVKEWLSKHLEDYNVIMLDGFPRTVAQAAALKELLTSADFSHLDQTIIKMTVPDEEIVQRLSGRSMCQNDACQAVYSLHEKSGLQPQQAMLCDSCKSPLIRRHDDEDHIIRDRLALYHKHEQELLNFYMNIEQPIYTINAQRSLEDIYQEVVVLLGCDAA